MKNKTLSTFAAIGAALTLTAQADLFDNFDSYADQTALLAAWNATAATGTGLQLSQSTPTPVSSPNDVEVTTTASYRIVRSLGTPAPSTQLDWSFSFYDNNGSRDFAQLYGYSGGWGVGLQTVLAIGVYNTGTAGKYMGRYSAISGAVYGDGAVSDGGTGGSFSLTSAGNRSVAWHTMEVLGMKDPNDSNKLRLEFYIDSVLGGSIGNINPYNLTYGAIGGAVSTTVAGSAYDDFSVTIVPVPEPSSIALGLVGGLAFLAMRLRRR